MIRSKTFYSIDNMQKAAELINGAANQSPTYKANLPLTMNTWTFIEDLNAIRMRGNTSINTWLRKQFYGLKVGDVIRILCEVYTVSGTPVKLSVNNDELRSTKIGQWETLSLTHLVTKNKYNEVFLGTWLGDSGEYMIKNIMIEVFAQHELQNVVESGTVNGQHFVKYADGTLECHGKMSATGIANKVWGALYYIDIPRVRFAKDFIDVPDVVISGGGLQAGLVNSFYPTGFTDNEKKLYTPAVEFYRAVQDTVSKTFQTAYVAKGRWFE